MKKTILSLAFILGLSGCDCCCGNKTASTIPPVQEKLLPFVRQGKIAQIDQNDVSVGNGGVGLASADFDGDGDVDLAVIKDYYGEVILYRNEGNGTYSRVGKIAQIDQNDVSVGNGGVGLTAGDFDNDGDIDLAVMKDYYGEVILYENKTFESIFEKNQK